MEYPKENSVCSKNQAARLSRIAVKGIRVATNDTVLQVNTIRVEAVIRKQNAIEYLCTRKVDQLDLG